MTIPSPQGYRHGLCLLRRRELPGVPRAYAHPAAQRLGPGERGAPGQGAPYRGHGT